MVLTSFLAAAALLAGCKSSPNWETGLPMKMDESTDKQTFAAQTTANPEEWEAAWDFLKNNKLSELDTGRYELTKGGTYATVSIYQTKEPGTARYEAHRRYIDIQYVASGREYIEITPVQKLEKGTPFDTKADIQFFDDEEKGEKRLADPTRYFVFFPADAHKPCLHANDTPTTVRKVVVKIPWK